MAKTNGNTKTADFTPHAEDPMLTFSQAGELIGRSRTTIRRWVEDGLLRSFRDPSGLSRIRQSELERFYSGTALADIR
jgi:excisionase family DNA binding protein